MLLAGASPLVKVCKMDLTATLPRPPGYYDDGRSPSNKHAQLLLLPLLGGFYRCTALPIL